MRGFARGLALLGQRDKVGGLLLSGFKQGHPALACEHRVEQPLGCSDQAAPPHLKLRRCARRGSVRRPHVGQLGHAQGFRHDGLAGVLMHGVVRNKNRGLRVHGRPQGTARVVRLGKQIYVVVNRARQQGGACIAAVKRSCRLLGAQGGQVRLIGFCPADGFSKRDRDRSRRWCRTGYLRRGHAACEQQQGADGEARTFAVVGEAVPGHPPENRPGSLTKPEVREPEVCGATPPRGHLSPWHDLCWEVLAGPRAEQGA